MIILLSALINDIEDTIERAKRGDLSAFNQLVLSHQTSAYNVAYRLLGNGEAAADACQDAFLKSYRALNQYRGGSFKSWLLRIVTNTCYDQMRYKQRRPATSLEDFVDERGDDDRWLTSGQELPEQNVMRSELADLLQEAINALPYDQRVAITLSDVHHYAYQEIADITNQPLGTIKSRLSRARRRIRKYLAEREELLPSRYRQSNQ